MSWATITETDVKSRLAAPELNALKSASLASGQANPLAEVITRVIDEVRGYCAVRNKLGPEGTVPDKLRDASLALIRARLCSRLPIESLMTETRKTERNDAQALLKIVAAGTFLIEEPTETTTEIISAPTPTSSTPTRNFTRESQDGI
jgi:hypothetical protein